MKLSIIIVNYNVKYFLEQSLSSVRKSCQDFNKKNPENTCEIFVVDNQSVDGSNELVKNKFPEVFLIENFENKGFSAANNQALKLSKGEYVLLLNPDTVVEENTFQKCIEFLDNTPLAGALGVKMIDGKGIFLPESKRALPIPSVAFCKIFGLSRLFPRSKIFGRYHLGYLNPDETHEVEILSGAFMIIRKKVLDATGLLDEKFFMYGEDIDLSYRITQAGFKNFYFPQTRIIHYKGESTKKTSINYVLVFYKAMIIFAKKHFSKQNANIFIFLINIAIYIRAGLSILSRLLYKMAIPFTDAVLLYMGMYFLKRYWEINHKYIEGGHYPPEYMFYSIPSYILIWMLAVYLSGGYDNPLKLHKIVRGLLIGTLVILAVYGLLPETFRFSRALILLGSVWALFSMSFIRFLLHFMKYKDFNIGEERKRNVVIAGGLQESNRVLSLLKQSWNNRSNFIGFVGVDLQHNSEFRNNEYYLGNMSKIKELAEVYNVDEIIFCSKDISSQSIIDYMGHLSNSKFINQKNIGYKIAPEESLFIIGSNSANYKGDLYTIDIRLAINEPVNKRHKRLLDLIFCLLLILISPLAAVLVKNFTGYFQNIFSVLSGKKSWVGYAEIIGNKNTVPFKKNIPIDPKESTELYFQGLPLIKKGVVTTLDPLNHNINDEATINRLNLLYAKNYTATSDIKIILKAFNKLGQKG